MGHVTSSDPNVFILPDLGEGVHEAEMIAWKVSVGDVVEEHQTLAEMETDKALVEVPSPRAGVIKTLHGSEGEILKVGNALVTYEGGDEAEAAPAPAAEAAPAVAAPAAEREDAGTVVGAVSDEPLMPAGEGKALATPAVRRLARDLGVDIDAIAGTGLAGRVTAKDVKGAKQGGGTQTEPLTPTPLPSGRGEGAETCCFGSCAYSGAGGGVYSGDSVPGGSADDCESVAAVDQRGGSLYGDGRGGCFGA